MEAIIALGILFAFAFLVAKLARWVSQTEGYLDVLKARYTALDIKRTVASQFGYCRPHIKFNYGRTYCRITQSRRQLGKKTKFTDVNLMWPNRDMFLHVSTTGGLVNFKGQTAPQIQLDNAPSFNSEFFTYAIPPVAAMKILSGQVQWKLEQLKKLCDDRPLSFSIRDGVITFHRMGWFKKGVDLEDYIQLVLEVFDQMMLANSEGMEFLHENEAAVVHDVKCPICSGEIMHEMVVCQRCKTPHCLDCWDYNSKCATFACNEKRYLRVNPQAIESIESVESDS